MITTHPDIAGMSAHRLDKIAAKMQSFVDQERVAGVLTAVYRKNKLAYLSTVGMMDREAEKPMREDAIFRIYSMTKPITATAVMMLYEDGHFLLTDPISRFIPEFKDTKVYVSGTGGDLQLADLDREITIRDLLSHTAGLGYGFTDDTEIGKMIIEQIWKPVRGNPDFSLYDVVKALAGIPLFYQPGTSWIYSLANDVLGYLVEVVSGRPFADYLSDHIFKPLEMIDTCFFVPDAEQRRFAQCYKPSEDGSGLEIAGADAVVRFTEPVRFASGGGGLVSTAADYLRFARLFLGSGTVDGVRLLSRKSVELMTVNHLPTGIHPFENQGSGYGLGFGMIIDQAATQRVGTPGTFGWGGAAGTTFWVDPEEELIGLLMRQTLNDDSSQINEYFNTLVYQAIND